MMSGILTGGVQELVRDFLKPLVAQEQPPENQCRCNQPGRDERYRQCDRDQNTFIAERAPGDRPHHRQLALCPHTRDLLRIDGQIITEHTCRFFGGDLGHQRDIVEHCRDIIQQNQQTRSGH